MVYFKENYDVPQFQGGGGLTFSRYVGGGVNIFHLEIITAECTSLKFQYPS